MAQSACTITDYKALICIFLNGGNDSNNLFIPTIPAEYANYAAIRTPALAIPNTDGSGATALALNNLTNDGHTYGIHPACPELQTLFNNGKLAAVFNVGTLVYPGDQGAVQREIRRAAAAAFLPRGPAGAMANVHPRPRARPPAGAAVARICSTRTTPRTAATTCSRCASRWRVPTPSRSAAPCSNTRCPAAAWFRSTPRSGRPPRRTRARRRSTTCSASTRCSRTCSRRTTRWRSSTRSPAARA